MYNVFISYSISTFQSSTKREDKYHKTISKYSPSSELFTKTTPIQYTQHGLLYSFNILISLLNSIFNLKHPNNQNKCRYVTILVRLRSINAHIKCTYIQIVCINSSDHVFKLFSCRKNKTIFKKRLSPLLKYNYQQ